MVRFIPDFSQRSTEREIMDGGEYTVEEAQGAYRDLRRVNRYLGGRAALLGHLMSLIATCSSRPVTILDIGTGSADIPQAVVRMARKRAIAVRIVALDANPLALEMARQEITAFPEISLVRADAFHLPFPDQSFDLVMTSEFLHHLATEDAVVFLHRLHGMARVAFVINDLRRHPIPYYSFWLLSHLFTRNRLIRNDGLISIRRGFTRRDVDELKRRSGLSGLSAYFHFPYRIVIVGRR